MGSSSLDKQAMPLESEGMIGSGFVFSSHLQVVFQEPDASIRHRFEQAFITAASTDSPNCVKPASPSILSRNLPALGHTVMYSLPGFVEMSSASTGGCRRNLGVLRRSRKCELSESMFPGSTAPFSHKNKAFKKDSSYLIESGMGLSVQTHVLSSKLVSPN